MGISLPSRHRLGSSGLEAAQIRVLVLQGAGQNRIAAAHEERLLTRLEDASRAMRFEEAPHLSPRSVRSAVQELMSRLTARGFAHVFRRQMPLGADPAALRGLHVVKVVVPRCEFAGGKHIRMGLRLMARVSGNASRS